MFTHVERRESASFLARIVKGLIVKAWNKELALVLVQVKPRISLLVNCDLNGISLEASYHSLLQLTCCAIEFMSAIVPCLAGDAKIVE